ncbi:CHAT domain-containing protein [Couchioplanes azureus]|uniref:CHAT domain-containing protein n=1 Tax=Couchioplanes caeruleus TaxID=56438 RepID=UPI00167022FD|nr:CHAT domain-containing protein [Couchioplanes caeruleus]GGQ71841.1 hypothetical protein GCM10010166_47520 [Couchioplanes caeruleus subsp. azureus]
MSVLTDLLDYLGNLPLPVLLLLPLPYLAARLVGKLTRQVYRLNWRKAELEFERPRQGSPPGEVPPAGAARADDQEPGAQVVSTGFARDWAPDDPLPSDLTLAGGRYLFWLAVAPSAVPGSIDDFPAPLTLPDDARTGELITVALFDYPGELGLTAGADVGRLILRGDGGVDIDRQPTHDFRSADRLLFPVDVPGSPGTYRLRCNIYCRNTLLQSRVVQVTVSPTPVRRRDALRTTLDYVTDSVLDPASLARLPPLRLSVFANNNDDGTHSFRFFGDSAVKATTVVTAGEAEDFLGRVRRTLSWVAWGDTEGWKAGITFKYLKPRRTPTFASDLKELALAGYFMWTAVIGGVACTAEGLEDDDDSPIPALQRLMRRPGLVEFANKVKASYTVPAALLYDFDLDTGVECEDWTLCEQALAAIDAGADLAGHPCFLGETTHPQTVVCPAGFWGFRHGVTLPQSVGGGSAPTYIEVADDLRVIMGVADRFVGRHTAWVLSKLRASGSVADFQDREQLLSALRDRRQSPHFVYFYCHGTEANGVPALQVGSPTSLGIDYAQVANGKIFWKRSRPLVFLNGCRTAVVQPKYAMNFVEAFIQRAQASGVIGTEIITDESLGARFGQRFLENFLLRRESVAEAMRSARLSLLTERDPLGMAFVAYAPPRLRLVRHADSCLCGSISTFGECCAQTAPTRQ